MKVMRMTPSTSSVEHNHKQGSGIEQYLNAISDADIRLLRIFCVVVAADGLSAATNELQADLSTVSRYVKELEDKVGARLCNRGRSGFSLTAQGILVHNAAQELFSALKSFKDNINTLHSDPVGHLRLAVMDALISDPQFCLSEALRSYKEKAPRVQVKLTVARPNEIERLVLNGDLDLGVVATREKIIGLSYHHLYMEKNSLYCSEKHLFYAKRDEEIDLAEASNLELIEDPYTESLPLRGFSGIFRKAATADSIEAVALLIKTGNYVGFLPEHYAAAISPFTSFRKIRPDVFSYEQGIELVLRSGPATPFVRGLLRELNIIAGQ
jgi:DNA-binding transcriptional LysR family regulator